MGRALNLRRNLFLVLSWNVRFWWVQNPNEPSRMNCLRDASPSYGINQCIMHRNFYVFFSKICYYA